MSGDHIVEQHVHNLDVAVWFLGRLPVSAVGFGGRARRETGNQFDFFSVDYDFGDGVHIHSQCRQISGTWSRVGEFFTGAEGTAFGGGKIAGKAIQVAAIKLEAENPYVQEHVDLIKGVIAEKPMNEAKQVAESTAVAIMGRMSSYSGELVRWSDMMEDTQSPFYQLTCKPTALDFERNTVALAPEVAAVPGK
jgi:predicted dehydrogenase